MNKQKTKQKTVLFAHILNIFSNSHFFLIWEKKPKQTHNQKTLQKKKSTTKKNLKLEDPEF